MTTPVKGSITNKNREEETVEMNQEEKLQTKLMSVSEATVHGEWWTPQGTNEHAGGEIIQQKELKPFMKRQEMCCIHGRTNHTASWKRTL